MREEVHALAAQGVRQQHFGGEPRHGDAAILQQARALEQRRLDGHGASGGRAARRVACCLSFSVW